MISHVIAHQPPQLAGCVLEITFAPFNSKSQFCHVEREFLGLHHVKQLGPVRVAANQVIAKPIPIGLVMNVGTIKWTDFGANFPLDLPVACFTRGPWSIP